MNKNSLNAAHKRPLLLIPALVLLLIMSSSFSYAVEVTSPAGNFKAKVFDGKIYNDRGKYTGMITPEGKMYDQDGNFTGQIKDNSILNRDGSYKGVIRDGKIYNKEGIYQGQIKR